MNYKIAVCDDTDLDTRYIASIVRYWAKKENICADIRTFSSAESFLFDYDERKDYDILLLDIEMPDMNGVELAEILRHDNNTIQIIFITGYPDFIAEGYEVSALHYLMKPISADKLERVLSRAADRLRKEEKCLIITSGGQSIRVEVRDIVSAEAFAHTCVLCAVGVRYELKRSITEVEKMLCEVAPCDFVRCHRSYIVGLKHIKNISKTDIVLDSGAKIPLSRNRCNAVNRAFIRCFKGELTWD